MSNITQPIKPAIDARADQWDQMFLYGFWGRAVFPLTDKRTPRSKGFPDTPVNIAFDENKFPHGYGVALKETDLILDYDPRRDPDGNQLIRFFYAMATKNSGRLDIPMPETYIVETPRGGCHIYFSCPPLPEGSCWKSNKDLEKSGFPAIEIKSRGRYVIGPGSPPGTDQRKDGATAHYQVKRGSLQKILPAPLALVEYCRKAAPPATKSTEEIESDDQPTRERFIAYCKITEPAVEGAAGNDQTFATACMGSDFGLSEQTTVEIMTELYNPRCCPPWDVNELERIVSNAYRYAQNSQGSKHPDNDDLLNSVAPKATDNAGIAKSLPDSNSPKTISAIAAAELMRKTLPAPHVVIPGLLPAGLTVIAAPPKTGKSFLMLSLSVAIANGSKALNYIPCKQGEVLYLALEDSQYRLQKRLNKVVDTPVQAQTDQLYVGCEIDRLDEGGDQQLIQWLDSHPNCRVIIVDTWGRFSPLPRGVMNAYENDTRTIGKLQRLAIKKGIALVVITHLNKGHAKDEVEQITGSMGISGAADAIWILKRTRGESRGTLSVTGRDIEERNLTVEYDRITCRWSVLGDAARFNMDEARLQIITYLEQVDAPVTPKEIAESVGKTPASVRVTLSRMLEVGQVSKAGRGKYISAKLDDKNGYIDTIEP